MKTQSHWLCRWLSAGLTVLALAGCADDDCQQRLTCVQPAAGGNGGHGGSSNAGGGGVGGEAGVGGSAATGGGGGGLLSNGDSCAQPNQCTSGWCVEGVCCDSACDDGCNSCAVGQTGSGSCSPVALGADPKQACAGNASCDGQGACLYGAHLFSAGFGGTANDEVVDVAVDPLGNIIITGYFEADINFGGATLSSAGGKDIFLAKFNSQGNHLWSKAFGAAQDQHPKAVAVDLNGNIVLIGNFEGSVSFGSNSLMSSSVLSDHFVVRFNSNGDELWSKKLAGYGDGAIGGTELTDVATDTAGHLLITSWGGLYDIDFGQGDSGMYINAHVTKLSYNTGSLLWDRTFPTNDAGNRKPRAVAIGAGDSVHVVGEFSGTVNFGGGALVSNSDGGFFVRFDSEGNHQASRAFASYGDVSQIDVAALNGGGSAVVVSFVQDITIGSSVYTSAGLNDAAALLLNSTGAVTWSTHFSGADQDVLLSIAADSNGGFSVAGYTTGSLDLGTGSLASAGSADLVIGKFDAAGTPLWSRIFGATSAAETARAVTTGISGELIVAGHYAGLWSLGGAQLQNAGGRDAFVAAFSP